SEAYTNSGIILAQKRETHRLQAFSEACTNTIDQYKGALTNLQEKLQNAYDGINKQNEALKELGAQQDEFVKKLNDVVNDRNEVVKKYNELTRQVEKSQQSK